MTRCLLSLSTAGILALVSPGVSAQVVATAGSDQVVEFPELATLDGSVTGLADLDVWIADGNAPAENHLLMVSESMGTSTAGPMQTMGGTLYGFPGDVIEISGVYYGIDGFLKQLYTIDPMSAICTPVGTPHSGGNVHSLAYDPLRDVLYGVDRPGAQLVELDRTTGAATPLGSPLPYIQVRGLAWDTDTSTLYGHDQATGDVFSIDPMTGMTTFLMNVPPSGTSLVEELAYYEGFLLATRGNLVMGQLDSAHVLRLYPNQSLVQELGSEIPDVSAHTLIVNSAPEPVLWTQIAGPGVALFDDPHDPTTMVEFTEPGQYILELAVLGPMPLSDQVVIDVLHDTTGTPFCFGDGVGDQSCPCNNHSTPGAGLGCTNSSGEGARLSAGGNPSTTDDTLNFALTGGPPGGFSVLTSGNNQLPANNPLLDPGSGIQVFDGLRCVGGGLKRHGSRALNQYGVSNNVFGGDFSPAIGIIAQGSFSSGQTRHFAAIYRDDSLLSCMTGLNFTNAISLTFDCSIPAGSGIDCNGNGMSDECELMGNDCNADMIPDDCQLVGNDCNGDLVPDDCQLAMNDCNVDMVPDDCQLSGNDCNANLVPDECDTDCNANMMPDDCESITDCNLDLIPDECQLAMNDCNVDLIPDDCQLTGNDCNTDLIPDDCQLAMNDCNVDLVPDDCQLAGNDCNTNLVPDECDTDCNANMMPDDCETITDCNLDLIPDECQLAMNDCNVDMIPDDCQLAGNDCNMNLVPDECDTDCNANMMPDDCETITDCNLDLIPDECQLAMNDCNGDMIPDDCQLDMNDCNADMIPDDCQLVMNDCNMDLIPDDCQLEGNDVNENGIPDDCEP